MGRPVVLINRKRNLHEELKHMEFDTATRADAEQQKVLDALDKLVADHDPHGDDQEFRGARFDHGLAWVQFPEGLGGLGVRPGLNELVEAELRRRGASPRPPVTFFMELAAPTILHHGTDEQRLQLLRPMFTGEDVWCQLFSEPGAGSDFAGLGCRAVRDGDTWTIDGQKVWNSMAHRAKWGMLVTRSDPHAPKHKGLTYFIVSMTSPGVEVRPLRQITGDALFNEVYLTDVRIPDSQRVGEVNDGWRVALTTLMNERAALGDSNEAARTRGGVASQLLDVWKSLPVEAQTGARRDQVMRLWCDGEVLRLTNLRSAAAEQTGKIGPARSIAKLSVAALNKATYDLWLTLLGPSGQIGYDYSFRRESFGMTGGSLGAQYSFLRVRANSIEGGTSEILRNIIGEQVLGLPGEPRADKDVPWASVPRNVS